MKLTVELRRDRNSRNGVATIARYSMTELDGLEELEDVVVIATTNRPHRRRTVASRPIRPSRPRIGTRPRGARRNHGRRARAERSEITHDINRRRQSGQSRTGHRRTRDGQRISGTRIPGQIRHLPTRRLPRTRIREKSRSGVEHGGTHLVVPGDPPVIYQSNRSPISESLLM